jgi:predicted RNA-binding Zn-ribbon protein involved in translation (DUF1610 family)
MSEVDCCIKGKLLIRGKYLTASQNGKVILLVRYAESNSFPFELREVHYCPFCGRKIVEHSPDTGHKNFCLPFTASAHPDHGFFVCKLQVGKKRKFLFNLVSDNEHVQENSLDYPSPSYIEYCPYCGKKMVRNKNSKISISNEFV